MIRSALLGVFCVCLLSPIRAADPDPREKPETAFKDIIALLDKKDCVTFFTRYMEPDRLKGKTEKQIKEEAEKFGASKELAEVLTMMKAHQAAKPEITKDERGVELAEFKDPSKPTVPSRALIKIGKYWYMY